MASLDDLIAEQLRRCELSGELQASPYYGKPLDLDDGLMDTPVELRLPFKILKEAGFVPHEVVMLRELTELKKQLAALPPDEPAALPLRKRAAELQQHIALRLEKLRLHGTL